MKKVAFYSVIFGILLVVSLASSSKNFIFDETKLQDSTSVIREFHKKAYTPHAPVVITSDADFVSQGWPGDGSENAPYLIQDLNITSSARCISISNTDVHFKIVDCFFSPNVSLQGTGIYLYDAVNGTIAGCEFEDLTYGIFVADTVDGNISNNNFRNCNWWGIYVEYTSDFLISGNDIRDANGGGVSLLYSDNNTVSFNDINATLFANINVCSSDYCDILNNSIGVWVNWGLEARSSIGVIFANNTFYDEFYGLKLRDCEFCTLENNVFEKEGFSVQGDEIEHFMSNSFENNIVESEPIAVLVNRSSETLDASAYGQLFLFNSSDCVVEDGNFDDRLIGVSLAFCSNSIVRNIDSIYNPICLVELRTCDNTEISLCNVSDSYNQGFLVINSDNCSVTECRAMWSDTTSGFGVSIGNNYNVTISDCSFGASGSFSGSGIWGEHNTGCWIINNDMQGRTGVFQNRMDNSTFMNNDFHGLQFAGLRFLDSTNLTVVSNSFHDNEGYGIDIEEDCEDIRIFNNTFINNELGNARDNGVKNNWDDGVSLGNQWDDYNGTGVYSIPGSAESADNYPVFLPEDVLPTIIGPGDKEFSTAVASYTLIWDPHDNHPKSYELYLNGSLIESGSWSGESIEHSSSIVGAGVTNITLIVYDLSGNFATNTVIVTIVSSTATETTTTTTETTTIAGPVSGENWWETEMLGMPMLWILGIGCVVVVLVIVIILKRK